MALGLTACGDDDSGNGDKGSKGGSGDGGYAQPEGPAPDLSTLEGGTTPLKAANGGAYPDACSVLSEEMVLKLLPAAGEDGEAGVQRSSEDQNGTPYMCQYFSGTADDENVGFIIVSFDQNAAVVDRAVVEDAFNSSKEAAADDEDFVDYKDELGAGSDAFFDGVKVNVLVGGMMFDVTASGTEPSKDDKALWRDNVDVPVAENMLSRLQ
ncbi:hypothetical protein ASD66_01760 [Nocardioides sp. Root151]|nr:hypothetical protein ASD30_08295 [Nocardioides sp. Root140]KQZ75122.1 hypothetical protein ASD66_01760 [Nocardioides sp. Root151]KRF14200.1 hypothetical protein ASH02_07555 [Nocardioides sp. Soil796]